jgi:hypothetical protein
MSFQLLDIFRVLSGLLAGGLIGLAFGTLQTAALRRNEAKQLNGQIASGWSLMPGAGVRVAYLVVALALVQLVCPLLFVGYTQWVVSAGVVVGYGKTLYIQLRKKIRMGS